MINTKNEIALNIKQTYLRGGTVEVRKRNGGEFEFAPEKGEKGKWKRYKRKTMKKETLLSINVNNRISNIIIFE